MLCKECFCVTEINGKTYCDCEIYGKCFLGDVLVECPEEQLPEFKEEPYMLDKKVGGAE